MRGLAVSACNNSIGRSSRLPDAFRSSFWTHQHSDSGRALVVTSVEVCKRLDKVFINRKRGLRKVALFDKQIVKCYVMGVVDTGHILVSVLIVNFIPLF